MGRSYWRARPAIQQLFRHQMNEIMSNLTDKFVPGNIIYANYHVLG